MSILTTGFETTPLQMQPMWQLSFCAPPQDIDRVFDAIRALTPLGHGKTDQNGYRATGGWEYYRPREGTPTGAEDALRRRPDVDQMTVFLPRDEAVLTAVIEAIYETHSYYEPVITLQEVLRGATKGLDDSDNPNRWWNAGTDWKTDG